MKNFLDIYSAINRDGFQSVALEAFAFQAERCEPYRRYVEALGIDPRRVDTLEKIPFMPIELFRSQKIYCSDGEPQYLFSSSGTTSSDTSTHYVASAQLYIDSYLSGFREFFGDPGDYKLITKLPSYRPESSLLTMIRGLQELCTGERVIVWGVTFELLREAQSGEAVKLPEGSIVLETGGMKGRSQEVERGELHRLLCEAYGVETIYSEYGMCELLSQGYSSGGGIFKPSTTMRVVGRSLDNPLRSAQCNTPCGLNIIDLANWYSCSFIATADKGTLYADGTFEVHGRIEGEILRGCTLMSE